mmetsp:Transcript_71524/g.210060  ORF Transcript_71524/g.210060 Transcript_71524/m.210060 type:complete len:432 (-) Transcript_71524:75-1370(-)
MPSVVSPPERAEELQGDAPRLLLGHRPVAPEVPVEGFALIVLPHGGQGGRLLREVVSQLNDVRVPVVPQMLQLLALRGDGLDPRLRVRPLNAMCLHHARLQREEIARAVDRGVPLLAEHAQQLVPLLEQRQGREVERVLGLHRLHVLRVLGAVGVQPLLPLAQLLLVARHGGELQVAELPLLPDLLVQLLLAQARGGAIRLLAGLAPGERLAHLLHALPLVGDAGAQRLELLLLVAALPLDLPLAVLEVAQQHAAAPTESPHLPHELLAHLAALGLRRLPQGCGEAHAVVGDVGAFWCRLFRGLAARCCCGGRRGATVALLRGLACGAPACRRSGGGGGGGTPRGPLLLLLLVATLLPPLALRLARAVAWGVLPLQLLLGLRPLGIGALAFCRGREVGLRALGALGVCRGLRTDGRSGSRGNHGLKGCCHV